VRETGCRAHVVHLSAAEALPMIAAAKAEGLPLSVETCPHYLCLSAEEISDGQTQFKCAPPIRSAENREALWRGLEEGVIDFIVSDHSPCTPELKKLDTGDFLDAWGGISSLQLGLPNIWTELKRRGLPIERLMSWLCEGPAAFAGLDHRKGRIAPGYDADLVVWEPERSFVLEPADLRFKHKLSPYLGRHLSGRVTHTFLRGALCYQAGEVLMARGEALLGRHA
jgi:allantoinase